jgi:hypothetical protein
LLNIKYVFILCVSNSSDDKYQSVVIVISGSKEIEQHKTVYFHSNSWALQMLLLNVLLPVF